MVSLNYIFQQWTADYNFTKSQENINHLMDMDDIKLFAKKRKKKRKKKKNENELNALI